MTGFGGTRRILSSDGKATLCAQIVLYNNAEITIERTLTFLNRAAAHSQERLHVSVAIGDCSPKRVMSPSTLSRLAGTHNHLHDVQYQFFDKNLGSAAGHNAIAALSDSDLVTILNPDVVVSPYVFDRMTEDFAKPDVGVVEARQIPIEHPKYFDPVTRETSWASTACATIRRDLLLRLEGFDDATFFLYCDDVDFSWRVRLLGYKVLYRPEATVFHDKRLDRHGRWISSEAERYYSAEAALLLPYKYSRLDILERNLTSFKAQNDAVSARAVLSYESRRTEGRLPEQLDPQHKVAEFINGAYAIHRFPAG